MIIRHSLLAVIACLGIASTAAAAPISVVIAYGDSLSDDGNFFAATGIPQAPYFNGRLSDGPVAVEGLAAILGVPLLNFAWYGATTGIGNQLDGGTPTSLGVSGLPGMTTAFAASVPGITPLASSALFVVWGGSNDFASPSPLDATPLDIANRAVANIVAIVSGLQALGAHHVLVPGMPDLGLTPFVRAQGPVAVAEATAVSDYFNATLAASLPSDVRYFDTAALLRAVVANPGAYGFTNVLDPCFVAAGPFLCPNPDEYLFWDGLHPTAAAHALLAGEFAAVAVPEPSAFVLALMAFSGVLIRKSRSHRLRQSGRRDRSPSAGSA
jgi:cholinesterase